jgi:hypothetical protein
MRWSTAVLASAALAACASNETRAGDHASVMAADTVRGVVDVVGAEPSTSIVLRTPAGDVTVSGERRLLSQLAGVEVTLQGAMAAPRQFTAALVHVRAVQGVPAIDGVLERQGAGFVLRTADGSRLALPHLPSALTDRAGSRIWLAGPLDRAPAAYGVILP